MNATKKQIRVFHAILAKRGLMDMKQQLVSDATDGRTEHSSEMAANEMTDLIKRLTLQKEVSVSADLEARRRMRRRIFSMCYTIGWQLYDHAKGCQVVDYERLNAWLLKYGYLHKPLNDYTYEELSTLVSQFETMTKTELE